MRCPYCQHPDSRVIDSRVTDDGSSIRRRRQCPACERRFSTVEQTQLSVVKRSGAVEPFMREKVVQGVRKACKGRPASDADLAKLGQRVEDSIRSLGLAEVPAEKVGLAILPHLRELDEVAYLRFASVYENYASVEDFETGIAELRHHKG
ncbi:MAG: transcriptional regulator NrdR [Propionibacteriaceae bacterium]|jgi:transcriptional repressor NrdR|nr:transcriptional regulator NrdR [Propionibacteriaceae bacterium]